MAANRSVIPHGYDAVVPYLRIKGAADAIAFYKKAFAARERYRLAMGDRVGHAEIEIGGRVVMLSDEFPEMGALGPKSRKGTTVGLVLMVADCEKAVKKAVGAGARVLRPPKDEFYGFRSASLEDPFGHQWMVQQHLEDVTPREMQKRLDAMMSQVAPAKKRERKRS